MDMPSGGHAGPSWGLWTAILEGSLMTALRKSLCSDPRTLLLGICP